MRRSAQQFGVRSSFHVGISMSAVSSASGRRPKENDPETLESGEHRPGWRPRKLIRHCVFDNWLAYLKNNPALSRCVNKLLRASGRAETLLQRKVSGLAESVLHGVEWLSRIEARCGSRMFGMPRGPHTCRGVVKINEESPRMVA